VTDVAGARGRGFRELIHAFELLEIAIHLIGEQRVEHVPEDLSGRRHSDPRAIDCHTGTAARAHTDYQQPIGAKMDGRAQRIQLAHGAIAEVLIAQTHGWKQHRNRRARHQMVQSHLGTTPEPLNPRPIFDWLDAVVKGNRMTTCIASGTQREGPKVAACDTATYTTAVDVHVQERTERRIIEHGLGW
jgi:hypothetical protein